MVKFLLSNCKTFVNPKPFEEVFIFVYTIPLELASQDHAIQMGPKAWHLSQLIQQGIPVPPGFVVSAQALELFLIENNLKERVEEPHFCHLIRQSAIPDKIRQDLLDSYKRLQQSAYPSPLSVTDDQIFSLAKETERIEALYSKPVDIEFAIRDGKLYILQVRPITT